MKKIRWGIVGCGDVTEVKSGPALQQAEGSALVAVMRRTAARAEDYAHRHGVPRWYDDAAALIRDPEVDAVYVATPPASHKAYTLAAARAGKPVYVEKPMALNYAGCRDMIEACRQAGVPLFVAYYRRALPRFLRVKTWLEEGAIGVPRFAHTVFYRPVLPGDREGRSHWRLDPQVAGCGYFCDLAPHLLDLLHYFFGAVADVSGCTSNQTGLYHAEDMVSYSLQFASGVQAVGAWNFCAFRDEDRTEIIGSAGRLAFSIFADQPIKLERDGRIETFHRPDPPHIQQPLIQTVVDELRGRGRCPSTGESGAQASRTIDLIFGRSVAGPANRRS